MLFPAGLPKWLPAAVFILGACLVLYAYSRGLPGDFVFDDGPAIRKNAAIQIDTLDGQSLWRAAWSNDSGLLKRPLSILSFALNHYFSGLEPQAFKLTNILIHLLNGASLAFLAVLLLGAPRLPRLVARQRWWVAAVVGLVWLFHPLHVSSVLYTVQRMTGLASLFMIWGMLSYVYGRLRQLRRDHGMPFILAGIVIFLPLAAFSKESGFLLLPYLLVIEVSLFNFAASNTRQRRRLWVAIGLTVALPILAGVSYLALAQGLWLEGYARREFSLGERLLTESRVLFGYLRLILLPDVRQMGLHLDDVSLSRGLLDPPSTLLALTGVAVLIGLAIASLRRRPLLAFAILWFFAGHSMESTVIPLEIAYEHRNYLPAFGVLLAAVAYLYRLAAAPGRARIGLTLALGYLLFLGIGLQLRATAWASESDLAWHAVRNHPQSARSHWFFANTHLKAAKQTSGDELEKHLATARRHFRHSLRLKPNMVASMVLLLYIDGKYRGGVSPDLIAGMVAALSDGVVSSSSLNGLSFLTDCQILKSCRVSPQDYMNIMLSAVQNPALGAEGRSKVFQYISNFCGRALGDYQSAMFYTELAIQAAPARPEPYYNKVQWLVSTGAYRQALPVTHEIERLDTLGTQANALSELRATLTEAASQASVENAL